MNFNGYKKKPSRYKFQKKSQLKTSSISLAWMMTNSNNTNDSLNNGEDTPLRSIVSLLCTSSGGLIEFNGCVRDSFDDGDKAFQAFYIFDYWSYSQKSAYSIENNVLQLILGFEHSLSETERKKGDLNGCAIMAFAHNVS